MVVAVARDASVGLTVCRVSTMRPTIGESLLCEVVDDRFGWFDEGIV